MRALSIVGERAIEVVDKPDPEPGPGELLIAMQASAICGSDLHIYRNPRPAFIDNAVTPGHEGCGVVAAVGEGVEGWSVGDRAVVYFRRTCGACRYCATGNNHVCANIRPGYGFAAGGSERRADDVRRERDDAFAGRPRLPRGQHPRLPGRHSLRAAGAARGGAASTASPSPASAPSACSPRSSRSRWAPR